jgi:hypothetical protein
MQPTRPFERLYVTEGTTDNYPPTPEGLEQWEADNVARLADHKAKKLAELSDKDASHPAIPSAYRSRPLTKTEAAKYLGISDGRLDMVVSRMMKSGKLRFEQVPQFARRYVFDKRDFPAKVWLMMS